MIDPKNDPCPCGSGAPYDTCCGPIHKGTLKAPTAEALMRARYSAYVKHEIQFILDTCVQTEEDKIDPEGTREWSMKSTWEGLEVVSVQGGGPRDSEGTVEFIARYVQNKLRESHHEVSTFKKTEQGWLYESGKVVPKTVVRAAPKVGRNDPCTCGSGKKYKHCCG